METTTKREGRRSEDGLTKGLACERKMGMYIFIDGWRLSVGFALALGRLWRHRI